MLDIHDADSAENGFTNHTNIIVPVACPVPNRGEGKPKLSGGLVVNVVRESRLAGIVGGLELLEEYFCNYEVDMVFRHRLENQDTGLQIAAIGNAGEVRAVEAPKHPFYLATLFQPQLTSMRIGKPHPIIVAYLRAVFEGRSR